VFYVLFSPPGIIYSIYIIVILDLFSKVNYIKVCLSSHFQINY